MRKKIAIGIAAGALLIGGYSWWADDWQQREYMGYVVGKSRGVNGNRKAIAAWSAPLAQVVAPFCEDEYGIELQAQIGRLDCPITMFDVDRASYESFECGERVVIHYREHRVTHERIVVAATSLYEWWDGHARR
jgi:hypothetical protein